MRLKHADDNAELLQSVTKKYPKDLRHCKTYIILAGWIIVTDCSLWISYFIHQLATGESFSQKTLFENMIDEFQIAS